MSLPAELLDQARHLITKEPRRPRQASLRRGVSAAYYALFHKLTEASSKFLVAGNGAGRQDLRQALRRSYGLGGRIGPGRDSVRGPAVGSPPMWDEHEPIEHDRTDTGIVGATELVE